MVGSINGFGNFNASEISQMRQNIFNKIDQNGDGSIDKTEMQNILKNSSSKGEDVFAKLDADNDAVISKQEFDSGMAKLHQEMKEKGFGGAASVSGMPPAPPSSDEIFSSLDTDSDGYVTADELKSALGGGGINTDKLLSEIDTDGDGKISKSESDTFLSQKMQSGGSMGIAAGPPPPPPPQDGEVDSDTLFSNLDTNQDGVISKAEWDVAQQNMTAKTQSESLTDLSANSLSSASSDMLSRLIEAILSAYSGSDTASSESNSVYA